MSRAAKCIALAALSLTCALPLTAQTLPAITSPVTDSAGVLEPADEEYLSGVVVSHRNLTGVHMAVVTLDDLEGRPIEDVAIELAESWNGGDGTHDQGALILLSTSDGRVRIELGVGLEETVTDGEARLLLEDATSALSDRRYGDGLATIVTGLARETVTLRLRGPNTTTPVPPGSATALYVIAIVLGVVALLFFRSRVNA